MRAAADRVRILIVGAGGMLGHRLVHEFCRQQKYDVHATVRRRIPGAFEYPAASYHEGVDLAFDTARLRSLLADVTPAVIINAAGVIKQRTAASDPDASMFINGALPRDDVSEGHLRELRIEDLLGRETVEADLPEFVESIMINGAAGCISSRLSPRWRCTGRGGW
jgi:FlaA1/EpsC-like NDP-sugar epimerase